LFGDEEAKLIKRRTKNQKAYELYLNGRFHRNKMVPEAFFKAIEYFNKAVEMEPGYAEAYASLAVTYFYFLVYNILPPDDCVPQLTETVQKALELDNNSAEAYLAKGMLHFYYQWNFNDAEAAFRKSIECNPNHGEAHASYAIILGFLGKHGDARKHAKKALEIDPFSISTNYYAGWAYFVTGDYELMGKLGKKMIELEPPFLGHAFLGFEHWIASRFKDAAIEFELSTGQKITHTYAWLGCIHGIMGEKDKAKDILDKLSEMGKNQYIGAYNNGLIYLGMGEHDLAFKWFNWGCDKQHDGALLFLKQKFKLLPGLKKDARMDELIKKFNLPNY
jgi:serine/threonine-protein kinase